MADPASTFERIRADLFRYYDTPFRVRLEGVMSERRALLDRQGGTWQEPWVEVLRPYALTGVGAGSTLAAAGAPSKPLSLPSAVCSISKTCSSTSVML